MSEELIKSVEESPILPKITETVALDLSVSSAGEVYIFHQKKIPEQLNWAEYDKEAATISLITKTGRIQDLGIKIEKLMQDKIGNPTRVFIIYVKDQKTEQILEIPMVILS